MKVISTNTVPNSSSATPRSWHAMPSRLGLALCAFMIGCSGAPSSNNPALEVPLGLPVATPPVATNTYVGTQSPGLWSLTVDNTQQIFSYQALTYPQSPNISTSGGFVSLAGYLNLTQPGGQFGGYALEVPSRVAILRPGDNTVPPVLALQQSGCFFINQNVTFQFVFIPNGTNQTASPGSGIAAYGSIAASSTPDGSSWSFGGQNLYQLPSTLSAPGLPAGGVQPGTQARNNYLTNFTASCNVTNGQATVSAPANAGIFGAAYPVATTYAIGSTGFLLEDQSPKSISRTMPSSPAAIGVVRPSAPLVTTSITAEKYLGFVYENGTDTTGAQVITTKPIGFGQVVAGAGNTMSGAIFPNDDVTQIPATTVIITPPGGLPIPIGTPIADTIINLGTQDPTNNGVYPLATITAPDPNQTCVSTPNSPSPVGVPGVDAYGNETCTFNAVAIVGNPENKYAIFISSFDATTKLPMGMYLFQQ